METIQTNIQTSIHSKDQAWEDQLNLPVVL